MGPFNLRIKLHISHLSDIARLCHSLNIHLFHSSSATWPSIFASDTTITPGEAYTLICRVAVQNGLMSSPQIMWLNPNGQVLSSEGAITVEIQPVIGNPTRLTSYALTFSPVDTSHAGTYTCRATVVSPYWTMMQSASATANITVQSECYDVNLSLSFVI